MKLDHLLTSNTRINSKWIKDLNVRPKTIKIIRENVSSKILDIAHRIFLLDYQARETKEKNKHMRLHETKNFCTAKEIINKIKR